MTYTVNKIVLLKISNDITPTGQGTGTSTAPCHSMTILLTIELINVKY